MLVNPTDNQVEQLVYAELYALCLTRASFTAEDVLKTLQANNKSFEFDLDEVSFYVKELMERPHKVEINTLLQGTSVKLRHVVIDLNKDYEYTITSPSAHTKMWFPKENPPEPIKVEYTAHPSSGKAFFFSDWTLDSIFDVIRDEGEDEDDF